MSFVAGWYPDPAQSGAVRWWDGAAWTASTAPSAPAAYAPTYPPAPVHIPQLAYGAVASEPWTPVNLLVPQAHTMATRSLVWGILSVPLFIAFPVWMLAIIYAAIGLARAGRLRAAGGVPVGRGRSIAGLVLGCVGALLNVGLYVALFVYSRYSS
jgi:hypothetical protein